MSIEIFIHVDECFIPITLNGTPEIGDKIHVYNKELQDLDVNDNEYEVDPVIVNITRIVPNYMLNKDTKEYDVGYYECYCVIDEENVMK